VTTLLNTIVVVSMASGSGSTGGLLSGVFTFVSRELESFVTNAAGGSTSQVRHIAIFKILELNAVQQRIQEPGPSTLRVNSTSTAKGSQRAMPKAYPDTRRSRVPKGSDRREKDYGGSRHTTQEHHRSDHADEPCLDDQELLFAPTNKPDEGETTESQLFMMLT
jgi:hypothetical protein